MCLNIFKAGGGALSNSLNVSLYFQGGRGSIKQFLKCFFFNFKAGGGALSNSLNVSLYFQGGRGSIKQFLKCVLIFSRREGEGWLRSINLNLYTYAPPSFTLRHLAYHVKPIVTCATSKRGAQCNHSCFVFLSLKYTINIWARP